MQYALVDGERREAFSRGRGKCELCHAPALAKCGQRVLHHWAHESLKDCDPWWENETLWHREWKNLFSEDCREVVHNAPDGEIHRADIKTSTGIFIEVQHSAITDEERLSRELFYKNLVWVVDGRSFRNNFDIFHLLPSPYSEMAKDIVWSKASRKMKGAASGMFFRLSEVKRHHPQATKTKFCDCKEHCGCLHEIHSISEIKLELEETYHGHHQYDWIRPHRTWLSATCPVYIDFGDDNLVKLEVYDDSMLRCICLVDKRKFIHDVNTETDAKAIATRFYPLPEATLSSNLV